MMMQKEHKSMHCTAARSSIRCAEVMASLAFTLFTVMVAVLELNIFKPISAVPQTMVIAQNTIKELYCPGYSRIPRWNISGGMDYQQADLFKEVLYTEKLIRFNGEWIIFIFISTLRINGSVENNGTTLQCTTDLIEIDVTVTVQGVLSAPSRVESTTTSTAILVHWDPPFTLDITDVDPDIVGYAVYSKNLDTGMTDAVNVTEPEFRFTGLPGEDPDPCHVYEFRVSAWSVVGESENSTVLQTCFRGAPQPVNAIAEVKSPDLMINVHFTITIIDITCHGRLPESIAVTVAVDGRVMPVYTYKLEYEELNFEIQDLATGNSCSASITARNQIGTSRPTDVIFDCYADQPLKVMANIPDQPVNLGAIVGGVVGGVLVLVLVLVVVVIGITVYKWKTKGNVDPEMKRNPAYEIHKIRIPPRHVASPVRTITGTRREGAQPSAGDGVSVEGHLDDNETFNTEMNVA